MNPSRKSLTDLTKIPHITTGKGVSFLSMDLEFDIFLKIILINVSK